MPSICAIVPTFNRAGLVVECLDSILRQTRPVDEIVVVDDGSTDNTAEVLAGYGARISVVRQANAGKAAALNNGLRHSTGDYVWICDDDDIAAPTGAARLADVLDSDQTADFVFGTFLRFVDTEHGREFMPPSHSARPEEDSALIHFLESSFTFQFAQLVRRSAFERVGGFREDLVRSQDYEMSIRLARRCASRYIPEIIFYQRQHDGLRGTSRQPIRHDQMLARWLQYDQVFFRELRASLELDEVVPKFARTLDAAGRARASLLQRACLFAQKALWEMALDDLEGASLVSPANATSAERHLAGAVVRNPLAWPPLLDDPRLTMRLRNCANGGRFGSAIVTALVRPLLYLTRRCLAEGRMGTAARQTRFLLRTLGMRRFVLSVGRSVMS